MAGFEGILYQTDRTDGESSVQGKKMEHARGMVGKLARFSHRGFPFF